MIYDYNPSSSPFFFSVAVGGGNGNRVHVSFSSFVVPPSSVSPLWSNPSTSNLVMNWHPIDGG
jgi:hypothetical protein